MYRSTSSQGDCIVNHILRSKHRNTSLLGPDSTLVFRCSRPLEIDCKIVVLGLSIISAQVLKEVRLSDFLLLRLRVSLALWTLVGAWCACLVAWSQSTLQWDKYQILWTVEHQIFHIPLHDIISISIPACLNQHVPRWAAGRGDQNLLSCVQKLSYCAVWCRQD